MEFKRVVNFKLLVIMILLVIVNCGFFYKVQKTDGENEIYSTNSEWNPQYDIFDVYRQVAKNLQQENIKDAYITKDSVSQTEYAFYRKAYDLSVSQIGHIDTYIQKNDEIVQVSDMKLSMDIYSQKGSLVRNNLLKTRYDFLNMKNISVKNGNYKGLESSSQYIATNFFVLIILFIIVIGFFNERKNGLNMIIHSTSGGRGRLLIKRFLILFGVSIIASAIFELSIYLESIYLYGGAENLYNPIQSAQVFAQCILNINFMNFIFLSILIKGIAIFAVAMIFWVCMELISSRQLALLFFVIFTGIELLIFLAIPAQSDFALIKYCNILSLFNVMKYVISYNNIGFGSLIMLLSDAILYFALVVIILSLVLLLLRSIYCDTVRKKSKIVEVVESLITKYSGIAFGKLSIYFKEIYKLIFSQRGIVVIAVSVYLLFYGMLSVGVTYNEVESGVNDYYTEVSYAQDKELFTKTYISELEQWINSSEYKVDEYYENKDEYHGILLSKEIATQKQVLEKIIEEQNYRKQQYEIHNRKLGIIKQPEYQVMTGSRMDSFEEYNAFLAVISVIIVTFGTISFEKKNNMMKLINSSTKGYKKNMMIKVSAALTCTFVIWAVIYGINFNNYIKVYDMSLVDLKYPVQSIMSLSDYPFPISIAGYFLIENLKRLCILIMLTLWNLFISWKSDYNYSISLSFIVLIPYILYFFGFDIFSYISVINWMI